MEPPQAAYFFWIDSESQKDTWTDESSIKEWADSPFEIIPACGLILNENEHSITISLAACVGTEWAQSLKVPKCSIVGEVLYIPAAQAPLPRSDYGRKEGQAGSGGS